MSEHYRRDGMAIRMIIRCEHWRPERCENTADTAGQVSASIGDGGRVEVELEPELPEGWTRTWEGTRCPEHAKGT